MNDRIATANQYRSFVKNEGAAIYGWISAKTEAEAMAMLRAKYPAGHGHSITLSSPANASKSMISCATHCDSPDTSGTMHLVRNR